MTAHAPTTPDVEALCFKTLQDLGGITVWQTGAECPWPHVADVAAIQVDVRASTKTRCRDRSYEVRQRMLRLPFDEPSVARVEVVSGPMWGPEDSGAPRYITRFAVTVRATRGVG